MASHLTGQVAKMDVSGEGDKEMRTRRELESQGADCNLNGGNGGRT